MNAHACRLPGERELFPGEPDVKLRDLGSPVTLNSFRLIHTDELSWSRDLPTLFTFELLRRSQARRIAASAKGLIVEAALETLKTFERALHRMYARAGWLSYLPDELAIELAKQLAEEIKSDRSMKDEVAKWLNSMRAGIAFDERFAFIPQSTRLYHENEVVEETFSRWLDYCEYVKLTKMYVEVLRFHRFIVCCARVHDAIFSTSITQPAKG